MSNMLYISITESRIAGSNEPFTFGLSVSNSYGTFTDNGYTTLEELYEDYPNKLDVLYTLEGRPEFEGAYDIKGSVVILESVSGIVFKGFPEDRTISEFKKL